MATIPIYDLSITEARARLLTHDFSARELAEACLKTISEKDSDIHAYLEVFDDVLARAENADRELHHKKEESHPLTGIPLAIKDNILIKGKPASCGSKILEPYVASYDATVIEKLKEARAVFLGRTNMDEFAMGSSTENSAFGPTRNPHHILYAPGGSSGGSAAAVSMGAALGALGSDTGGSVRQPASFCGIVGLKPTYGAVSRFGLVAMASSLDQIGPFAKTVEDTEIIFNTIKGKDSKDSTSTELKDYKLQATNYKLTIGVPDFLFAKNSPVDKDVLDNFESSLKALEKGGHSVQRIKLASADYALPVYYIVMPAEVSSNLARFDGVRYGLFAPGNDLFSDYANTRGKGFGKETQRRILLGTYVLSSGYYDAYYEKAVTLRRAISADCAEAFKAVNVIATPTSPTPAFRLGERTQNPLSMYLSDILTVLANVAGIPAISIPSGFAQRGEAKLPLGIQFMAASGREDMLFAVGKEFETFKKI